MGVALYFIDKLALRAGHEKDDDEADTVGCCNLKVPHAWTTRLCTDPVCGQRSAVRHALCLMVAMLRCCTSGLSAPRHFRLFTLQVLHVGSRRCANFSSHASACSAHVNQAWRRAQVENVECLAGNHIKFDFLGKDSIRYENEVAVAPRVWQLVQQFCRGDRKAGARRAGLAWAVMQPVARSYGSRSAETSASQHSHAWWCFGVACALCDISAQASMHLLTWEQHYILCISAPCRMRTVAHTAGVLDAVSCSGLWQALSVCYR